MKTDRRQHSDKPRSSKNRSSDSRRSNTGKSYSPSRRPAKREEGDSDREKRPYSSRPASRDERPAPRTNRSYDNRSSSPVKKRYSDPDQNEKPESRRFDRDDRPSVKRPERSDRSERPSSNRFQRSDRPTEKRFDRDDRPAEKRGERGERGERSERSTGSRFGRSDRPTEKKFDREDRPTNKRTDREDRPSYGGTKDSNRTGFEYRKRSSNSDSPYKRKTDSSSERSSYRDNNRSERSSDDRKPRYGNRDTNDHPFSKRYKDKYKPTESVAKKVDDGTIRINKYIANAGICSRREADEMIKQGSISINGKIITELGTKVNPGDEIKYNGERISQEKKVYILLNKPKDTITTVDDPHAENTVMELIKDACKERVYPVGRLDRHTTGVLLFTNDGDMAKKLTHPKYEKKKVYHVYLDKNLKPEDMAKVAAGIELEDGFIKADSIDYVAADDKKQVGIQIHSGRNRIVRRIFESLDYNVEKLDRVFFAGLTKKGLQRGHWRFLTNKEIQMLKMGAYE